MLIQCTRKLLEQLNIKSDSHVEENPLFSWHAHFLLVNRRKAVVLVNDLARYVIVLHGLKAKDYKSFDQLLVEAIRETFEAEGIRDDVLDKYLTHSMEITYSKTKDRTSVARLNKACETIYFYQDLLDHDDVINTELSKRVSRSLVGDGKNKYIRPNEELYKKLEEFVGHPIFMTKAVQLKVVLKLEDHHVWRRIVVPINHSFEELHDILQTTFGWKNHHLHEFVIYEENDSEYHPIMNLVCDIEAFAYPKKTEMRLETDVKISEYIPTYKKIKYTYDFGDNWQHDIEVEEIIGDYHVNYPTCLEGEGNTPPEDVGGIYGYKEFLSILANPQHPDYNQMVRWGRMQGYKNFDIVMINGILKNR
ncbi:MAG TPA: plasmid pRiA4b ORF-3 family protein [Metabacillus sp.]|nr:plasmid pRiA4b ORF-3 family protein [Metabacillus sp.]